MLTAIVLITALLGYVIIVTVYWNLSKPSGNLWFGVTLPAHVLEHVELRVLQKSYRHIYKKSTLAALPLLLPILFLDTYISLSVIYMLLWGSLLLLVLRHSFVRTHKSFTEMKRSKEWFAGDKRVVRLDTRLSAHKETMKLSLYWFILPALIAAVVFILRIFADDGNIMRIAGWSALGMTLLLWLVTLFFSRMKARVYSLDSELNLLLNRTYRQYWSRLWLGLALTDSCFTLIMAFTASKYPGSAAVIWNTGTVICSLIPILGILYVHKIFSRFETALLAMQQEIFYTDDDEYWINGTTYNNPNDRAILVPKRNGAGSTVNLGTKAGKRIYYGLCAFAAVILAATGWITVLADFSSPALRMSDGRTTISFPMYSYSFSLSDVQKLTLAESLPQAVRRMNGIATDTVAIGNFELNQFGESKLYISKNSPPYIVIRLPDLYVLYNHKEAAETRRIFTELNGR
ncbi:DUF5808 domain-containing protein [Paenibacillus sp. MMS20-IR301]|uniref:DUF5808 domain-containing protein n=1 Tax=Paenibacillus sp. MMS20-IR301 TaxID=2895946 RepID=UPI0028E2A1B1|nr:DUF5808 domain-containing protein [Paenibacillus sp. MMS20-IR301]WNS46265.1 DUF5808 domain-containing protein [Paenibacillus sp. MMS20-IR301]